MAEDSYLIGIDMGGTYVKMMVADRDRNIVDKTTILTQREHGYEKVVKNIIAELESILAKNGLAKVHISAMGLGIPWAVDNRDPQHLHSTLKLIGWEDYNPCKAIASHFDTPYAMENDSNLGAIGEYTFGSKMEFPNMILLTLGTGVGGGIIADGKIYRGGYHLAGEFGHMTITPDSGEVCLCGRLGCLEAYCSGSAMAAHAKRMMVDRSDTVLHELIRRNQGVYDNKFVTEGALKGDDVCIEIFKRFNYYLTIGCANIMKMFNPERLFIGGGIAKAGDLIFGPLNRDVPSRLRDPRQFCPIEPSRLGHEAGVYGAIALADMVAGREVDNIVLA